MDTLKRKLRGKDDSFNASNSQYKVEELQVNLLTECSKAIDTKTYPSKPFNGDISSFLILLRCSDNAKMWDSIKSKFGYTPPEYQIVVYQRSSSCEFVGFLLHEGGDINKEKDVFLELQNTLTPLLREGTILLNGKLLKQIILPKPLDKHSMMVRLVDLIQSSSEADSEWVRIIQLLQKNEDDSSTAECEAVTKSKTSAGSHCSTSSIGHETATTSTDVKSSLKSKVSGVFGPLKRKSNKDDVNSTDCPAGNTSGGTDNDDDYMSEKVWVKFRRQTVIQRRKGAEPRNSITLSSQESFDTEGMMALMIAIEKGYVKSVFNFLLAGSNPNLQDKVTGNTSLHIAVRSQNLTLVKLLIAFDADVAISNVHGKTPLDLAKDALNEKIIKVLEECGKLQAKANEYYQSHSKFIIKHEELEYSKSLLSLDGGGIRAFNATQIFIAIENRMKQLNPKCKPLVSHFDYVAGTSAGSIAGTVLMYTDANAKTGRYLVHKIMTDVFEKKLAERGPRIDQFLQDIFGQDRVMGDLDSCQKMIVTGTLADRSPNKLHLMTSYGESRDGHPGPLQRKVWEAVRISSAAPLYFPPFDGHLLDGGLMANNPTLDAMVEIMEQNKKEVVQIKKEKKHPKLQFILSIGTGVPPTKSVENIEVFVPGVSLKTLSSIPGNLKGFGSFFNHLITQVTQSDGQEVNRARVLCETLGCTYYRLSPPLPSDIDPSTTDRATIADMLYHTQLYILSIPDQIDSIAKFLLSRQ